MKILPHFRHLASIVFIILLSISTVAQTVHLSPIARQQFLDQNAKPLAGGFLYTYISGTTTYQSTYTDATGTAANTNPIVLDSGGNANIWLTDGQTYRFCLQTKTHVPVFCVDGISNPTGSTGGAFNPASPPPIGNTLPNTIDGTTITAHTQIIGNLLGNVNGNLGGVVTGSLNGTVNGSLNGSVTGGTVSGTTITASTGFSGSLNGTVGATTPTTANFTTATATSFVGPLNGNATTATTATTANTANNALALTGLVHFRTSATCNTTNAANTTCTGTFSVPFSYSNAGSWDIVCSGIGQTGFPAILALDPASGTTFNYVIANGTSSGAVASGYAALACIAYGN